MKKYTLPITLILILFVSFGFMKSYDTFEEPLYLDLNTTIQCIIENSNGSNEDKYIRTLKVTYKDHLDKPIKLQNGDKLYNRCSFESELVLYSESDSLVLNSWRRMSCEIIAFFNLKQRDSEWLKVHTVNKLKIKNITTDFCEIYKNEEPLYLMNIIKKYNTSVILE